MSPRAAATPSFLPGAEACNRAGEAARASRPATGIGSRGGARPPSASPSRRRSLRARTAPAPARRRAETPLRRAAPRAMPRDEADPPPPPPPARAAGQRPPHLPHRSSPARPPPHPGGGGGGGRTPLPQHLPSPHAAPGAAVAGLARPEAPLPRGAPHRAPPLRQPERRGAARPDPARRGRGRVKRRRRRRAHTLAAPAASARPRPTPRAERLAGREEEEERARANPPSSRPVP